MLSLIIFAAGWVEAPRELQVPDAPVGSPTSAPLVLTNPGDKAVRVRSVTVDGDPGITVDAPGRLRIRPGASAEIPVTASLAGEGRIGAIVWIEAGEERVPVSVVAWTPGRSPYAQNAGILGALSYEAGEDLSSLFGAEPPSGILIGTAEAGDFGLGGLGSAPAGSGSAPAGLRVRGRWPLQGSPRVEIYGDPIILGALDIQEMDAILGADLPGILACYTPRLQENSTLTGKVVIKFTVATDGSVSQSVVKSTTLGDAAVEACVAARVQQLTFPKPKGGGIVIASYPFRFTATE